MGKITRDMMSRAREKRDLILELCDRVHTASNSFVHSAQAYMFVSGYGNEILKTKSQLLQSWRTTVRLFNKLKGWPVMIDSVSRDILNAVHDKRVFRNGGVEFAYLDYVTLDTLVKHLMREGVLENNALSQIKQMRDIERETRRRPSR